MIPVAASYRYKIKHDGTQPRPLGAVRQDIERRQWRCMNLTCLCVFTFYILCRSKLLKYLTVRFVKCSHHLACFLSLPRCFLTQGNCVKDGEQHAQHDKQPAEVIVPIVRRLSRECRCVLADYFRRQVAGRGTGGTGGLSLCTDHASHILLKACKRCDPC